MPKVGWHPVSWQLLPRESTSQPNQHLPAQLLQSQECPWYAEEFLSQRDQVCDVRNGRNSSSSNGATANYREVESNKSTKLPAQSVVRNTFLSHKRSDASSRNFNNFSSSKSMRNVEFSHKDDDFPSLPHQQHSPGTVAQGKTPRFSNKSYSDRLQNTNQNVEREATQSNRCEKNKVAFSNMHRTNTDILCDQSANKKLNWGINFRKDILSPTHPDRKSWLKPPCNENVHNFGAFNISKNTPSPTKQQFASSHKKQSQTISLHNNSTMNSNNSFAECISNSKATDPIINGQNSVPLASSDVHTKRYTKSSKNRTDENIIKYDNSCSQGSNLNAQGAKTPFNGNNSQNVSTKAPKTKKKRKSKLKRNLAFQTGKITILTPEMHSLFTGGTVEKNSCEKQNGCIDVGNTEEYPELGNVINNLTSFNKKDKLKKRESFSQQNACSLESSQGPISNDIDAVVEQIMKPVKDRTVVPLGEMNITATEKNLESVSSSILSCKETVQLVTSEEGDILDCHKESSTVIPKSKHHDAALQISFSEFLSFANLKIKSEKSNKNIVKDTKVKVVSTKKNKIGKNPYGPHNVLDSSSPAVKRGKEREIPKARKYTALKKIILKERKERKEKQSLLLQEVKEELPLENTSNSSGIIETVIETSVGSDMNIHEHDIDSKNTVNPDSQNPHPSQDPNNNASCNIFASSVHQVTTLHSEEEKEEITFENETQSPPDDSVLNIDDYEAKKLKAIQLAIHSRNFREYCNHLLSAEIDELAGTLLGNLTRFQDRMHQKDPVKARIKRRLVYGIKEVKKHLRVKKLKCVIIAPDLENIQAEGGLNHAVKEMVNLSNELYVPCIFALRRKNLGRCCMKPVPVSCVGIFNYDGSEACFKKLVDMQEDSKTTYKCLMDCMKEVISETDVQQLLDAQACSPTALQLVRTDILRDKLLLQKPDLSVEYFEHGMIKFLCNKE